VALGLRAAWQLFLHLNAHPRTRHRGNASHAATNSVEVETFLPQKITEQKT
jgi:hypothetical protein